MERVSHLENGEPTSCLMMAYMLSARKMKWIKNWRIIFSNFAQSSEPIFKEFYISIGSNQSLLLITHGFSKKTQKTPPKEILRVLEIRKEFEEEYENGNS